MQHNEFMKPLLRGSRFDEHAIPLTFLKDLAALEEMIVEVAKYSFLQERQDRKRCPRGFTSSISLKLTAVGEGSAIPCIKIFFASTLLFATYQQYFEEARHRITMAIDAASRNESVERYLDKSHLSYFDRIGRSLADGESIEFNPGADHPAVLTKEVRRNLVLAGSTEQLVTETVSVFAKVPAADHLKKDFDVQLSNGAVVHVKAVGKKHWKTVTDAFAGFPSGSVRIHIQGTARVTRSGTIRSIEKVTTLTPLAARDVAARLDELQYLPAGWLDGEGVQYAPDNLSKLGELFDTHWEDDDLLPYVYPTPEGAIRFEWEAQNKPSLEINLDSFTGEWHELSSESDEGRTNTLSLTEEASWKWIKTRLLPL